MPVKRVEWECPGCKRRFAIPAEVPTPQLCPQCQAAPPSPTPSPTLPATPQVPPSGIDEIDVEEENVTLPQLDVGDVPSFQLGPQRTRAIHPGEPVRRKYPTLRMIASLYKLLAALLAVGALAGLFRALMTAFNAEDFAGRTASIMVGLYVFGGGIFAAVGLLAAAELIHVLLDIEENTRSQ